MERLTESIEGVKLDQSSNLGAGAAGTHMKEHKSRDREKKERAALYHIRRASWTKSWSGNSAPTSEETEDMRTVKSEITLNRKTSCGSLPRNDAARFLSSLSEIDIEPEHREEVYHGAKIGKYVVGRLLDKGSFSECYEGRDTSNSNSVVAMKVVRNDPGFSSTMEHELAIWSRLKHRGFLPLKEVIRLKTVTIIISPVAHRGSLLKYLKINGPMTGDQARGVFKTLCEGLRFLHRDLRAIHHDIKLENILLDKDLNPYLCDFGLSEYYDDPASWIGMGVYRDDEDMLLKGTLWYLPPEIIDCRQSKRRSFSVVKTYSCGDWKFEKTKVDIWAMGIVLYALMSGTLPFTDDYLPSLQAAINNSEYESLEDEIDAPIWNLIQQLLCVEIAKRPNIDQVLQHPWLQD